MKALGNIDLQQNLLKNMVLETVLNYPANPKAGEFIFKDKRVLMCVEIAGAGPVWVPMTGELNTHVHDQGAASTTWTIVHDLGSARSIVQVMGTDGRHLIPDEIDQTVFGTTTITFSTAEAGKAILMIGSEDGTERPQYSYTQDFTSSTVWVVTHGLGFNPQIRAFIGNQEVQPLSVVHDDLNTTTVTWSTNQSGTVKAI